MALWLKPLHRPMCLPEALGLSNPGSGSKSLPQCFRVKHLDLLTNTGLMNAWLSARLEQKHGMCEPRTNPVTQNRWWRTEHIVLLHKTWVLGQNLVPSRLFWRAESASLKTNNSRTMEKEILAVKLPTSGRECTIRCVRCQCQSIKAVMKSRKASLGSGRSEWALSSPDSVQCVCDNPPAGKLGSRWFKLQCKTFQQPSRAQYWPKWDDGWDGSWETFTTQKSCSSSHGDEERRVSRMTVLAFDISIRARPHAATGSLRSVFI